MSLNVVAPDTITSWVASAFALHKQDGLGIAAQSKVNILFSLVKYFYNK